MDHRESGMEVKRGGISDEESNLFRDAVGVCGLTSS